MSFRNFGGFVLVPTLGRLVLGLAFAYAGLQKVQQEAVFTGDAVQVLQSYNVSLTPVDVSAAADAERVSFTPTPQDEASPSSEDADDPYPQLPEETPTDDTVPSDGSSEDAGDDLDEAVALDPSQEYTAKGLHRITLMCHDKGWSYPTMLAWAAAITELIGGGLILLGLFARVWGLALASVMGVAFHMTSWPLITQGGFALFAISIPSEFNQVYIQLAFFVMSLGILFTGAGPLSLDRVLFGRSSSTAIEFDD